MQNELIAFINGLERLWRRVDANIALMQEILSDRWLLVQNRKLKMSVTPKLLTARSSGPSLCKSIFSIIDSTRGS